jgi:hypothetical protein
MPLCFLADGRVDAGWGLPDDDKDFQGAEVSFGQTSGRKATLQSRIANVEMFKILMSGHAGS